MTRFHSDEYVNFLQTVTPDNLESLTLQHGGLEQGIARCKASFGIALSTLINIISFK